ncbi:MAG: holo-ACP synthase [Chloroflexota bacterium]|nr:holo-ACP synthase [Chloroflexota bacterium]
MFSIGVDIVEVNRIERAVSRWGERFLKRVFTAGEIDYCAERSQSLAARWAAKEAVSKALGTGWAPQEAHDGGWIDWTEIEVCRQPSGEPGIRLHGKALSRAQALGLTQWRLSLSHSNDFAVAMVLGWAEPNLNHR